MLILILQVHSLSAQNYPIGRQTITITDASRSNRQIPVEIFYPAVAAGNNQPLADGNGEMFPVIAFGHGFSMNFDPYSNFWNHYVPQGYILIFPKTEIGPIPFPSHNNFAQDLNYCLTHLLNEHQNPASLYFGKIRNKTALMGHSMGGGCSFIGASYNSSLTTLVGFAPAETNNPSSISISGNISIPTLVFAGSRDNVTPASGNATPMYQAVTGDCKAYVTITNASHCGFAQSSFTCEFGESTSCLGCSFISRTAQHNATFQLLDPWLRFFLKGECEYLDVFNQLLNNGTGFTFEQSCSITDPVADYSVSGATSFCEGDSVSLTAFGDYDYLWSDGSTVQSITVMQSNDYFLIVTNAYECSDTSATTTVEVFQTPTPVITAKGSFDFCEGETNSLNAGSGFSSYLWQDGNTDSVLSVTTTGLYYVAVTDNNGCSGLSDSVVVTVNELPATPVITQNGDTLFATAESGSLQWFRNGIPINGQHGNFLIPDADGEYAVAITNQEGCSTTSTGIQVTIVGLNAAQHHNFLLYPNPTQGLIFLSENVTQILVFDLQGAKVRTATGNMIDLNGLPDGMYYLQLINGSSGLISKVIKH